MVAPHVTSGTSNVAGVGWGTALRVIRTHVDRMPLLGQSCTLHVVLEGYACIMERVLINRENPFV